MASRRHSSLWTVLSLVLVASLAEACTFPNLFPTPTPTPLVPIAPTVFDHLPARGDELALDGQITVYFDSPMDQASAEQAFSLKPQAAGTFTWPDAATLVFQPSAALERATRYTVTVAATARSAAGPALAAPVTFTADTVGFLEVAQVIPAPDTFGAEASSVITVMFNRPVVPLTSIADQAALPNPLTLEPAVAGKGEWLNTSIFVFRPNSPLAGGETYTARIKAGLQDTTGGLLKDDFQWQFSVQPPQVVSTDPAEAGLPIGLTQVFTVTFNQPMDHLATQNAFKLLPPSGPAVSGAFKWTGDDLSLVFMPAGQLALATTYQLTVDVSAKSAGGAALSLPYTQAFDTVLAPGILATDPADGAQAVNYQNGFNIYFVSPMDVSTVDRHISILPEPTAVYTYFSEYNYNYYLGWNLKPSTDYTVTLEPGMQDPYGNATTTGRILHFRTAPLDPQAFFNANGPIGTFNAYNDTVVYITTRNVETVNLSLFRVSPEQFAEFTGPNSYDAYQNYRPKTDELLRDWTVAAPTALNEDFLTKVNVAADAGGALEPGVYYLLMRSPGLAEARELLVVSGANLTLKTGLDEGLVWATDLNSGQPISGLPIALYDQDFRQVAEGTTDANGLYSARLSDRPDLWTQLYAVSRGGPGRASFALGLSNWSDGIDPWEFGLNGEFYPQKYVAYLYTDRPVYRPGQVVNFKGILRTADDARFKLADVKAAPVTITDDRGQQVFSDTLDLTPFGTFAGEFQIGAEAGLGYYSLQLNLPDLYSAVNFSVAEYRKPEFQVTVAAPAAEVAQGATIAATVDASFFFGGAVSNADVHWSVLSADHIFQYDGPGYYDFYDWDWSSGEGAPQYGAFGKLIAEKDGKTDAQGRATFEIKADLSDASTSQVYTIEATVTDVNGQQVSGRTEVIVHQGQFYAGVRPEQYVATAGQAANFNLVSVDWHSQPAPGQKLHVVFNQHEWLCAQEKDPDTGRNTWTCHVKDTQVDERDVTTDAKGQASVAFIPPAGGTYQLKVTGADAAGHAVTSSTILWVASERYVSWRQDNNDRITLVTDRKSYKPGDTAEILIPSPFQGAAQALITIERGRILEKKIVNLAGNSTVYKLPITANYAPDVFFSVVIVKGVDENNPAPAFKVGLAKLSVSPEQQQLNVTITPDKEKVGPRDTVNYTLKVTDYAGKPVQGEFSIGVVDLAVLQLAPPNSGRILDAFYGERGLGIRTGLGLTLSVDRYNVAAAKAKGGGGGAEAGFNEVRGNFLDTAFWNATVTTDANGLATIPVTLPDNLTTWRLDARGLTADTLVGQSTVDIVATKDLLIRPNTPRFFVVGDQAQVGAVVNNNTNQDLNTKVTLAGTGVTLTTPATVNVTVRAKSREAVYWNLTVGDAAAADLTFSVTGGGLSDASKPTLGTPPDQTLPIYKYSAPETVATAGQLEGDKSVLEAISLPRRFDATQGQLEVEVDPSLAASMTSGLEYLEHFPYECTEQTVSRFLPNVLTYQAMKKLGLSDPQLEANLAALVNVGLQRLYARQHVDGGWGWWSNDASDPNISAYVVFGLAKAKEAGFTVSDGALTSGVNFLQMAMGYAAGQSSPGKTSAPALAAGDNSSPNLQAWVLYVLAEAGYPDISATVRLYENRANLQSYGRAYLALTLGLSDGADPRIRTVLSDLNNAVIISATGAHWEESQPDWLYMNTDTRSTAIVLDALARLDPQNSLAPNVVRWLMSARQAQGWETTQETAWALISLTDWMVATGELKANYNYSVSLNGKPLASGQANADNLADPVNLTVAVADLLKDQANRLVIERGAGDGRLYYTAHLSIYQPVEDVRALSRGVVVARQYSVKSADCGASKQPACPAVTEASVGQDIQVKLTLIAPNDLYHVVVEDPFPAGAEPVDTSLLTTSVVGEAPQLNSADPLYYGWGWWWFSSTDIRDEKVVLFATYLPKGTYEYTYTLHASLPGTYKVIPSQAREFYFPEVFGRGDGTLFTIKP